MKDIIDSNKLLAEFMGGKYNKDSSFELFPNEIWLPVHGICVHNSIDNGKILKYHSSFDWLIPVIEKIYQLNMYYKYVEDTSGQFENKIELTTNISLIYKSAVEFIKWYNKNK